MPRNADLIKRLLIKLIWYKTTPEFWDCYNKLPPSIQKLADRKFNLLKENSSHPSLELEKVGEWWRAKVSENYRTLAFESKEGLVWFWIGNHDGYMALIRSNTKLTQFVARGPCASQC